mmetsp:Transcript_75806/g.181308  ORF Transcript_75806/g.181308 Transcript_75806/m.181308 type:complete len:332 (-) Transcript_75806:1904-2899(-)
MFSAHEHGVADVVRLLQGIAGQQPGALLRQGAVVLAQLFHDALHSLGQQLRAFSRLHPTQVAGPVRGGGLVHLPHNVEVLLAQGRGVESQVRGQIGREIGSDVCRRGDSVPIDVHLRDPELEHVGVELLEYRVHTVQLEVVLLEDLWEEQPALLGRGVLWWQIREALSARPVELGWAAAHVEALVPQKGRQGVPPAHAAAAVFVQWLAPLGVPVALLRRLHAEVHPIHVVAGSQVLQPAPAGVVHLHIKHHPQAHAVGILHQLPQNLLVPEVRVDARQVCSAAAQIVPVTVEEDGGQRQHGDPQVPEVAEPCLDAMEVSPVPPLLDGPGLL